MATENRGGKREGAGRKKKPDKQVTVSFCCSPAEKELLQKNVKDSGLTQSAYITQKLFV